MMPSYTMYLIPALLLLIQIFCSPLSRLEIFSGEKTALVKKGVLDLRETSKKSWDFEKSGSLNLEGEWSFYWEEFLSTDEILKKDSNGEKSRFVKVPSSWSGQKYYSDRLQKEIVLPSYGYATYRMRIYLDESFNSGNSFELGIAMPDTGMAYRLFINGILHSENGKVGKSAEEMEPFLQYNTFVIKSDSNIYDIVVHVSNYQNSQGGIWENIKIGLYKDLQIKQKRDYALDHIVFGCLFIMSLYHLGIYFFRRKDKTPLYFGIFCTLVAIRTLSTQERYIWDYFPFLPFILVFKLEYIAFFLGVPVFALFLQSMFPEEFSRRFLYWTKILCSLTLISVIVTPIPVYTEILKFVHILTFLLSAYSSIVVLNALKKKRSGARMFFLGGVPFFWSIMNDILHNLHVIHTFYMASYGFLVFILIHSVALSRRYSMNISSIENTSEELEVKTNSLEKTNKELLEFKEKLEEKVSVRTYELEKATKETENSMRKMEALNEFMKLINSTENMDLILNHIYDYVFRHLRMDILWLVLVDRENREFFTYRYILPQKNEWSGDQKDFLQDFRAPINMTTGTLYQTFRTQEIFYLSNIYNIVSGTKNKFINEYNGRKYTSKRTDSKILLIGKFTSLIQIPLIVKNETIGILNLAPYNSQVILTKNELLSLIQFGEQIAGVIRNMRLLEETESAKLEIVIQKAISEKTRQEIEVLNTFNRMINEMNDLDSIFKAVTEYIFDTYHIEEVWLLLTDEKRKELVPLRSYINSYISQEKIDFRNRFTIPLDERGGVSYYIYKRQKPFYLPRIKSLLYEIDRAIINNLEVKSFLNVPMVIQGKTIGVLFFTNSTKEFRLRRSEIDSINGFCQQIAGVIHNSHLLKETEEAKLEAEKEREKSEELLLNILPKEVASELKEKGSAEPVLFDSVSVLFTDFKGFTKIAEKLTPHELIKELDGCFVQFDKITERFKLEKLKTIGDSYMCAGGIPRSNKTHAVDAVLAALEIQAFMNQMKEIKEGLGVPYWELRLGIHSGPLVAGVIGEKKFAYDVWGDTVNTASRMESSGTPGKINISGATYNLVKDFFDCEYRGKVNAKNKGEVDMYYVLGIRKEFCTGSSAEEESSYISEIQIPNSKFWENYKLLG